MAASQIMVNQCLYTWLVTTCDKRPVFRDWPLITKSVWNFSLSSCQRQANFCQGKWLLLLFPLFIIANSTQMLSGQENSTANISVTGTYHLKLEIKLYEVVSHWRFHCTQSSVQRREGVHVMHHYHTMHIGHTWWTRDFFHYQVYYEIYLLQIDKMFADSPFF